ncbi:DUF1499 domain-containing protein [Halomonas sp. HP20-15]|uniref:DUF1499 domain-containing protein n=1 Tax=Halomonas sp. HP20-15 TaxID=3085901 RepID=UPI00298109FC|nr:DUF1499 domain-containing protein [Halomonas sp. HP20-15]MDW5377734.1 DUF1499 domain-containing protein [Halomonas sp. HP20-15]
MATSSYKSRPRGGRWPRRLAWLSVLVVIAAALLLGGAGPAHRLELVDLGAAFGLLRQGAYLALGAAVLGLATLVVASLCRRPRPALVGALVLATVAAMMVVPWQMQQRARQVPAIHDITTDMRDPPAFVALAPAREAAPNGLAYPGETTASQQREAYPDIRPLILNLPLAEAMDAAEATARQQGWELVDVGDDSLEATATTRWFGFKDDVAIRLRDVEDGVRVDVRSASRVGRSDVGTNAARIRAYLAALSRRAE